MELHLENARSGIERRNDRRGVGWRAAAGQVASLSHRSGETCHEQVIQFAVVFINRAGVAQPFEKRLVVVALLFFLFGLNFASADEV
jgi:hypothetical protein